MFAAELGASLDFSSEFVYRTDSLNRLSLNDFEITCYEVGDAKNEILGISWEWRVIYDHRRSCLC